MIEKRQGSIVRRTNCKRKNIGVYFASKHIRYMAIKENIE